MRELTLCFVKNVMFLVLNRKERSDEGGLFAHSFVSQRCVLNSFVVFHSQHILQGCGTDCTAVLLTSLACGAAVTKLQ